MTLQGLPAAITSSGMSFAMTLPAPITFLFPMVTPGQMTALPPTQTSSHVVTGFAYSSIESQPVRIQFCGSDACRLKIIKRCILQKVRETVKKNNKGFNEIFYRRTDQTHKILG